MTDPHGLKKFIRKVEDFPIPGIIFRDITSLIETPQAFTKTCKELTKIGANFESTHIATVESRGFIFAGPMASSLAIPCILARKPGKLPNPAHKKVFDLEYGTTSVEIQKNTQIKSSDRLVIVDDLVATGGTAIACAEIFTDYFLVPKENILILGVIDLPSLGGSKKILDSGYFIETLVSF